MEPRSLQTVLPADVYSHDVVEESRLQLARVLKEVGGPHVKLEPEVELVLLHLVDDFVMRLTQSASLCAAHRGSTALDVDDVNLALEMDHGIQIPGFPNKRQRTK